MAGLIAFFGSRLMAWVVLGGGAVFVVLSVLQSAKNAGARKEAGIWKQEVAEKARVNRAANREVNIVTDVEEGNLAQQEADLRQKWRAMGRAPTITEPKGPAK